MTLKGSSPNFAFNIKQIDYAFCHKQPHFWFEVHPTVA